MAEITTREVREFLSKIQGQTISLVNLRRELNVVPGSKSFDFVRNIMFQLAEQKVVRSTSRGEYKVITQVKPVKVFDRPLEPPYPLIFPRDHNTDDELCFTADITLRGGDLIVIAGVTNFGKTLLCMNFLAENIDLNPILMGNEYTTLDGNPAPRLVKNLESMAGVPWREENGDARFTLLPVRTDYAEHIVPDRINIIDWINMDTGDHYMIGSVLEGIKRELRGGIGIVAIQKSEFAEAGRGGQFTRDFADCELLLGPLGDTQEALLKIGKVKEPKRRVMGRTFAYGMENGVHIVNFREVVKCKACWGKGWRMNKPCDNCNRMGYIDDRPY